jgi:hypothetical protein
LLKLFKLLSDWSVFGMYINNNVSKNEKNAISTTTGLQKHPSIRISLVFNNCQTFERPRLQCTCLWWFGGEIKQTDWQKISNKLTREQMLTVEICNLFSQWRNYKLCKCVYPVKFKVYYIMTICFKRVVQNAKGENIFNTNISDSYLAINFEIS